MYVVIFKAILTDYQPQNPAEPEYASTAQQLRELAFSKYGCLDFVSSCEGNQELTLSYWPSLEHIARWKSDPTHQSAQQWGRQYWYHEYSIQVAEIQERPDKT